jgi:alpha-mannosidase
VVARGAGGAAAAARPFVAVDAPNVVIETVKQAEDGRGLVVRLYESQRRRGEVTLRAGFPVARAWRTNLLEEAAFELPVDGDRVRLPIRPYEIATIRLELA